jgi:hypothetical protein
VLAYPRLVPRRLAIVLVFVFGLGALVLAALPFQGHMALDTGDTFLGGEGLSALTRIEGPCRAPVFSAGGRSGSETRGVWAVTVGTDRQRFTKMDGLCTDRARRRLLGSLGLCLAAVAAGIVGRRMQPPAASPTERAPAPEAG